ncbi:hypothetical protein OR1_01417 [Geobacter sp. OR-1]|uniref:FlgO family outer membrane protein n=1 Tax=Geobacter sp. OR-1 TaxID=1266765 RepID=UPI0005444F2B|nr:FlgO family outer membrane protein [Geobacter sp. OR-1]GAM09143.1 hypothetical protein OR1_01417 [Geobacter sp. OR-1]
MKSTFYWILSYILSITLLSACAPCHFKNCNNKSEHYDVKSEYSKLHSNQRYLVNEPLNIQRSSTQIGNFNAQLIFLADQLERNIDRKILANTFIITSFANLDKLNETTSLGRLVSENLIHELQVRHWKIFDVRLTKDIVINDSGEFSLSRDIKKIRDTYKVGGIVAGTYSVNQNHIVVNARVIDIETGIVASAGQVHLPLNDYAEELLYNVPSYEVKSSMKIIGGF